jgi:hypothetical protein
MLDAFRGGAVGFIDWLGCVARKTQHLYDSTGCHSMIAFGEMESRIIMKPILFRKQ